MSLPDTSDVICLLSMARDQMLVEWVATFAEGFKDPSITNLALYRKGMLKTVEKYEAMRVNVVNTIPGRIHQTPSPIKDLVTQHIDAIAGPRGRDYTLGQRLIIRVASASVERDML